MGKIMSTFGPHATANRDQEPAIYIQSLPSEILPFIFAQLSVEDCKSVRLTCKLWYKHSFEGAVTKNQKFVFTETDSIEEIGKFLAWSTDVHVLNLEFLNLPIHGLPSSVWKKCGHQVHSLLFHRCDFGDAIFAKLMMYCVNLTSLIVEHHQGLSDGSEDDDDGNLPVTWSGLIENGVRRPKLRTFHWFHDDYALPTSMVKHIFTVYPRLTYFGTGPEPSFEYQLSYVDAGDDDQSQLANFNECLEPSMPLERIIFNKATDGSWMRRSILKPEWSSRLIELQTLLSYKNLPDFGRDLLFTLFATQKKLQVVTLNELEGDEGFVKDLMFCIFEKCPDLRELQLRMKNDDATRARPLLRSLTFRTYSEFARFFSYLAKLECFVVNFDIKLDFPSETLASLPRTDFAMEQLHLDQSKASELFCRLVVKRCSKLKHLKVAIMFDDILQEIFKNTDLETLILVTFLYYGPDDSKLTDYGFTGRRKTGSQQEGFSIKQLQKLERLKLSIYDRFHACTKGWQKQDEGIFTRRSGVTLESIRELQFPKLKGLNLFLELESELRILDDPLPSEIPDPNNPPSWYCLVKPITQLPGDILIHLASSLPAMEKLHINPVSQDFAAVSKMCQLLKHLSVLQCDRMDGFDAEDLFNVCPSLKNIDLYKEGDEQREQFRRCPLTNEIQCRVLQRRDAP